MSETSACRRNKYSLKLLIYVCDEEMGSLLGIAAQQSIYTLSFASLFRPTFLHKAPFLF